MGGQVRALTGEEVAELLQGMFERHAEVGVEDLYKLAHQAILGPGHLLGPRHLVLGVLHEESARLDQESRDWEEVVEVIHPEVEMARVHLRPYLRSGGALERLVDGMFKTQELLGEPDLQALAATLGAMRGALAAWPGGSPVAMEEFDALLKEKVAEGLPAVHHSEVFSQAYDPHYRVVMLSMM